MLGLEAVVATYVPMEAAVEETFVNRNAVSTLRLGQARGGASRPQWFRLRRVRRPGGHEDHLEAGRNAAVGVAVELPVALNRLEQRGAPARRLAPFEYGIRLAHSTQVGEQRERIGIRDREGLDIGHGESESGALKQVAGVANIGKRRDAGAEAAFLRYLRLGKRTA